MKRIWVTFSSPYFLPRAQVCTNSIHKYYPDDLILIEHTENTNKNYVQGLAKQRIEKAKKLLESFDEVVIIGADCVLYDKVDTFLNMPGTVLIPHVVTPPSNPPELYKTGHVNADLMLFRQCSIPLLNWLISCDMKEEINNGSFFEQTLLSASLFFFDNISICKDPTINFAYFNFIERKIHRIDDTFYLGKEPLKMVQYSGYIDGKPEKFSKYYNGPVDFINLQLFKEYQELVDEQK